MESYGIAKSYYIVEAHCFVGKDRGVGILRQEMYAPRSEREHFSVVAESWKICPEERSKQEHSREETSVD